jgi:hypothetical protein
MTRKDNPAGDLPACVIEYVRLVIRKMGYSRAARREVRQELIDHFADALAGWPAEDRQKRAEQLIAEFGDAKLLATLIRRGKKRCRPVWLKAMIRSGQGFLLLVALFGLYSVWFVLGRPTISADYLATLNEQVHPKVGRAENAWPLYESAIRAYVEPPRTVVKPDPTSALAEWERTVAWPGTVEDVTLLPDFMQTAMRDWIDRNEAAWEAFAAASRKPCCWKEYGFGPEVGPGGQTQPAPSTGPVNKVWDRSLMSIMLPHLSSLRQLARIGVWKSQLTARDGRLEQAFDMALTAARAGRHWQNPPKTVIEQLVGISMGNLAYEQIRRLAGASSCSSSLLESAQKQLQGLYADGYPPFSFETERLSLLDTVQRVFTQGGPGGGHVIPHQLSVVVGFTGSRPQLLDSMTGQAFWAGECLLHAGRDETLSVGKAFYDQLAAWAKFTPYERKMGQEPDPDLFVEKLPSARFLLLRTLLPSLTRAAELSYRNKAEYEATETVLALRRYRLDKGQYPDRLEDLLGGYLERPPMDPYSAGPLVYRRTGDGFTLYSVAANYTDDGGTPISENGWEPSGGKGSGGDHVFWPVPVNKPEIEGLPNEPAPAPGSQPSAK